MIGASAATGALLALLASGIAELFGPSSKHAGMVIEKSFHPQADGNERFHVTIQIDTDELIYFTVADRRLAYETLRDGQSLLVVTADAIRHHAVRSPLAVEADGVQHDFRPTKVRNLAFTGALTLIALALWLWASRSWPTVAWATACFLTMILILFDV